MLVSGVEHNDSISVYNKSITTTDNWTSLVAQLLKNPPAMWKTWDQSLVWEDPLEKGKSNPLQYSDLENSTDCIVHWVTKS